MRFAIRHSSISIRRSIFFFCVLVSPIAMVPFKCKSFSLSSNKGISDYESITIQMSSGCGATIFISCNISFDRNCSVAVSFHFNTFEETTISARDSTLKMIPVLALFPFVAQTIKSFIFPLRRNEPNAFAKAN